MASGDEFDLIARYFAPIAARAPGALGLGDDAALMDAPGGGETLVICADALIAGVHFLPDDPPDDIARKLVRVNLSDLAAMGAHPRAILLTTAWPAGTDDVWIAAFARGLADDCAEFGVDLLGGDTVSTPGPASFSLTAIGSVPGDRVLKRAGARPGDVVAVSGTIGDAALGLDVLRGRRQGPAAVTETLIARYRRPTPRLALGVALRGHAHALMDISDGLLADCRKLCRASGVGAVLELAAIPFSAAANAIGGDDPGWREQAITGGDDYELLVAGPRAALAPFLGDALTEIGRIAPAAVGVTIVDADGAPLSITREGWVHHA